MQRHALCIGINDYPDTSMDLAGCVNDAHDWSAALRRRGFEVAPLLLDHQATKRAMVDAIERLLGGARSGDLAAITFSGHGSYVYDAGDDGEGRGDEDDGFDEALCPHDIKTRGDPLTDDEIHALFAARRAAPKARRA